MYTQTLLVGNLNLVKELKITESLFCILLKLNNMKKYRFYFYCNDIDTSSIYSWRRIYYLIKFLGGYTLDYEIPKRIITNKYFYEKELFKPDYKRGPVFKEEEVDWRETIYNFKIEKVRNSTYRRFKVSFSVKLTPKEAYIIGEEIKHKFYNCRYKCNH